MCFISQLHHTNPKSCAFARLHLHLYAIHDVTNNVDTCNQDVVWKSERENKRTVCCECATVQFTLRHVNAIQSHLNHLQSVAITSSIFCCNWLHSSKQQGKHQAMEQICIKQIWYDKYKPLSFQFRNKYSIIFSSLLWSLYSLDSWSQ